VKPTVDMPTPRAPHSHRIGPSAPAGAPVGAAAAANRPGPATTGHPSVRANTWRATSAERDERSPHSDEDHLVPHKVPIGAGAPRCCVTRLYSDQLVAYRDRGRSGVEGSTRSQEAQLRGVIALEANLGPDAPRWAPTTEEDIRVAVDTGLLKESHYIDVKREAGSSRNANKETARDIASFAIDGGPLLYGVEEDNSTGVFTCAPQPLNGLIEKIDNIARTAIEPPLVVNSVAILSDDDPSLGYVLVNISPSPVAPHMVDGRYYGRAERSKRVLSDGDVLLLHTKRESIEEQVGRLLDREIDREPVAEADRRVGHLYVVAQPINPRAGLARSLTRDDRHAGTTLVWNTEPEFRSQDIGDRIPPTPREATSQSPRANGLGLSSHAMSGPGRDVSPNQNTGEKDDGSLLDIELRDDGGIRVLVGRATFQRSANDPEYILDGLAVAYARRLVAWATAIGDRTGWRGSWMLGVHCDRLRGRTSAAHANSIRMFGATAYDELTFREVTRASHLEMQEHPNVVARRLIGRLVETLGTFATYGPDLTES
jgi:hypothetical protein